TAAFLAALDGGGWPDLVELDALGFVGVMMSGCPNGMILRASSAESVAAGDSITLNVYDIFGPTSTHTVFRDGSTIIGIAEGSFTTSLQTVGRHVLTATT